MTYVGTSHFISEVAAVSYYRPYYGSRLEAAAAVSQKLREGEIRIGRPTEKPGERTFLIDNGTRWAVEEAYLPTSNS